MAKKKTEEKFNLDTILFKCRDIFALLYLARGSARDHCSSRFPFSPLVCVTACACLAERSDATCL